MNTIVKCFRNFLSAVLFFIGLVGNAQKGKPAGFAEEMIPKGWKQLHLLKGDLNKDGKADIVLIIEQNSKARRIANENRLGGAILNLNPRKLIVLFREGQGYKQVASSSRLIPSEGDAENPCLADPLANLKPEIVNGVLKIHLNYWLSCGSWYVSNYDYIFRYQNKRFELIGLDYLSFHRASGEEEKVSINFMTQKKQISSHSPKVLQDEDGRDVNPTEKWESFKAPKRYTLEEMTPEIASKLAEE